MGTISVDYGVVNSDSEVWSIQQLDCKIWGFHGGDYE
jgi:hypothetical protein